MRQALNECNWLVGSGGERRVREAINRVLERARGTRGEELREAVRSPFFGPVSISQSGEEVPRFSAFTRDISPFGIGLLHIMPLKPGQVVISLRSALGEELLLRTQITWCESAGEGWYISGGRFLDVFERAFA
jgi:hypothetical protein